MATTKKTHPADAADLALIPACKKFTATILKNNKPQTAEFGTLGGCADRSGAAERDGEQWPQGAGLCDHRRRPRDPRSRQLWQPIAGEKAMTAAKAEAASPRRPTKPAKADGEGQAGEACEGRKACQGREAEGEKKAARRRSPKASRRSRS